MTVRTERRPVETVVNEEVTGDVNGVTAAVVEAVEEKPCAKGMLRGKYYGSNRRSRKGNKPNGRE
jgi:hypothetical protein